MSVYDALTRIEERSQSDSDYAGEPSALVPLLVAVARAAEPYAKGADFSFHYVLRDALAAVERYANEHLPGGA